MPARLASVRHDQHFNRIRNSVAQTGPIHFQIEFQETQTRVSYR
jgi:hypothetical protein